MIRKLLITLLLVSLTGGLFFGAVNPAFARKDGGGGGQLTPVEIEGLLYMREEEKPARDVYIYHYSLYGLSVFYNISRSEQHHMDAVLNLLNNYGLPDPASNQPGVFTNPELQALYEQLIAW